MTPLPESLLESVAAAAVREGLADAIFTRLSTPIGRLLVVQGPRASSASPSPRRPRTTCWPRSRARSARNVIGSDRELAGERDALSDYLEGDATVLDLPVDLRLTPRRSGAPCWRS